MQPPKSGLPFKNTRKPVDSHQIRSTFLGITRRYTTKTLNPTLRGGSSLQQALREPRQDQD